MDNFPDRSDRVKWISYPLDRVYKSVTTPDDPSYNMATLVISISAFALHLSPPQLLAAPAARRVVAAPRAFDETGVEQHPAELLGPWELSCSLPGVGRTWLELGDDGECACSSKVGSAREWGAMRERGRWQLRFVLLDKLKRPNVYKGQVDSGERRRLTVSGVVKGPPKRADRPTAEQIKQGVVVGTFEGYQLE